jgi:hypothetical protein
MGKSRCRSEQEKTRQYYAVDFFHHKEGDRHEVRIKNNGDSFFSSLCKELPIHLIALCPVML